MCLGAGYGLQGWLEMTSVTKQPRLIDAGRILSGAALASIYVMFAWAHLGFWRETGRLTGLGLVTQELLIAVLLVMRRSPQGTSRSAVAWVAAGVGSFPFLLARPSDHPVLGLGTIYMWIQLAGTLCAVASLLCLGRSFGLVAANRGIRVSGAYRLVRHPTYASYFIAQVGYLLESPSSWNLGLLLIALAAQLARIAKEEQILSADPAYQAYRRQVRYRLIPFVY
jgi:protein-S-isoprenylcysteine O-methyltransferase Ste14